MLQRNIAYLRVATAFLQLSKEIKRNYICRSIFQIVIYVYVRYMYNNMYARNEKILDITLYVGRYR